MARFKTLLAVLFVAAIIALVAGAPVAQAQSSICPTGSTNVTAHYVGAGSSAQFQMAAIAANQAAISCKGGGAGTIKHWSKKFKSSTGDGAYLSDNRNALIVNQTGNIWIVWIENGSTVTDFWTDISVDSTVGVRCVLAQEIAARGCQLQVTSANGTATDQIIPANLWVDNAADAALDLPIINAINTAVSGGVHVNVGLTDIRPEDAAYATNRSKSSLTSTFTGLGYTTANKNVGANIVSGEATGAFAQPVGFALPGKADPFTKVTVSTTFSALPIGAAPIVFITNNNGSPSITNLVTGITPSLKYTGQTYPAANLFDGTTTCDTDSLAFGGNGDGLGTALHLFLREPLSGTMNTTEFSVFRSFNNTKDSQEAGVGGSANNPLQNLPCASSTGDRTRAIGTGEVVGTGSTGVLGTANSLGYIFTGWGNLAKFTGQAKYNYLTVDGVDPLFAAPAGGFNECVNAGVPTGQICGTKEACSAGVCTAGGNAAQTVPFCSTSVCTNDLWTAYTDPTTSFTFAAGQSYPNVRYGLYKVWSIYRWIVSSTDSNDAFGPFLVSQEAQNYVNGDVADFIPFSACAPATGNACFGTTGPTDGLAVFRSHFQPAAVLGPCTATTVKNGQITDANLADNGNTLGGGNVPTLTGSNECGGDVGGLIFGPYGTTSPAVSQVTVSTTHTVNKGFKITFKTGDALANYTNGEAVSLNGGPATISVFVVNAVTSWYSNVSTGNSLKPVSLVGGNVAHGAASATQEGTTFHGKHQ